MTQTDAFALSISQAIRRHLPGPLAIFSIFALKQAWACLFGATLLVAMVVTRLIWQEDWLVARYDALLIFAIALQASFVWLRLETWTEVRVIALFHLTGTAMEIFKVHMGSWAYPDPAVFQIYGVPLYSGFMYAAVGSFMARVIRLFDMRFTPFPPRPLHFILAVAIYLNFFVHHYAFDLRYLLFAATILLYARTRIWFCVWDRWYWMPLPVAAFFSSFFLWLAENIGTATNTWVYAGQHPMDMVSFAKMGSWYLLLYVAFATVSVVVSLGDAPRKSGAVQ